MHKVKEQKRGLRGEIKGAAHQKERLGATKVLALLGSSLSSRFTSTQATPKIEKLDKSCGHAGGHCQRYPRPKRSSVAYEFKPLPRIRLDFGGRSVVALIDTAAVYNFINSETLPDGIVTSPFHMTTNLAANGASMNVCGEAKISFQLQGKPFKADVLVTRILREPLLLDWSWSKNQEGIVDFIQDALYIGRN